MSPRFPQSQDKPDDSIEVDNNSDFVILDTPSVVDQLDQVFENILTRRTLDNQSSPSIETTGLNNSDLNTNLSSSSSSEMGFDIISSAYAAVVAAGGIMGYVKAGSVPSLIAGLVFGGTLGVGAYMTSKDPSNYYLTLGTSTLLTGLMGYRFYNSGKFMPAGLIACISFAMVLNISYRALSGSAQHVKK